MLLAIAAPAYAQGDGKWEVEFHGGGGIAAASVEGSGTLPAPGPTFLSGASSSPSRQVPSWYFGDGAMLLNEAVGHAMVATQQKITPLDAVLNSNIVDSKVAGNFGVRITRTVTPRFSVELAVDYHNGGFTLSPAARAGIEASRASFIGAWTPFVTQLVFSGTPGALTSVAALNEGNASQLFTTGSLVINLRTSGLLVPYVTIGGGMLTNLGDWPGASLTGNYQFSAFQLISIFSGGKLFKILPGSFPINETDAVTIQATRDKHAFASVVGGGIKYSFSRHWGVRGDARVYLSEYTSRVVVSATPSVAVSSLAGAVSIPANPTTIIVFSNNPSQGPSTLSGSVTGFETFSGSNIHSTTMVTAGVYVRF